MLQLVFAVLIVALFEGAEPVVAQTVQILHEFTSAAQATEGGSPAALVGHPNGNLYGVANTGGAFGLGTLFTMTPTGTITAIHAFAGGPGDGASPYSLILGNDGNLYGATSGGGANQCGAIVRANPAGGASPIFALSCPTSAGRRIRVVHATADGTVYATDNVGGPWAAAPSSA